MKRDRIAYAVSTSFQHYLSSVGEETIDVAQARVWYTREKAESALSGILKAFPESAIVEVTVGSDRTGSLTINGFPRSTAIRKGSLKRRIWSKYGRRCAYCGAEISLRKCHLDQYYPKMGNDPKNLMPACDECFCHKKGRTPGEFQEFLERSFSQVRKHYLYKLAKRYGMVREAPWTFYYLTPEAQAQAQADEGKEGR